MIRDEAVVTVREPVPGMVTRRQYGRRKLSSRVVVAQVHPDVLEAARAALRPGERLVLVSASEVRTVYR